MAYSLFGASFFIFFFSLCDESYNNPQIPYPLNLNLLNLPILPLILLQTIQILNHRLLILIPGKAKRIPLLLILMPDLHTQIHQKPTGIQPAIPRRIEQTRLLLLILEVDIGAEVHQDLDHAAVALAGRVEDGGLVLQAVHVVGV